jgi:hypothetical protein
MPVATSNPLEQVITSLRNFSTPAATPEDIGGGFLPVGGSGGGLNTGVGSGSGTSISIPGLPGGTIGLGGGFPSGGTPTTVPTTTSVTSGCQWWNLPCVIKQAGCGLIFIILGLIAIAGAIYLYKPGSHDAIGLTIKTVKGAIGRTAKGAAETAEVSAA